MASRALDHVVWVTQDLDHLADTFRRLGFTVGRRNRHPWGTVNHIVQFDGCFLELLGFPPDYRPLLPDDPAVPFAGFCADVLTRSTGGAAMLVLRSDDATADAALFRAQGLGEGRLLPFSRAAQGPYGSDRTVAFTIAFASLPGLPEVGAFACQQHHPENFWDAAAQKHSNGATGIRALVIEAQDVEQASTSLHRFAGSDHSMRARGRGAVPLSDCMINVVPATHRTSRIAALQFGVGDLGHLRHALGEARFSFSNAGGEVQVEPDAVGGTAVMFHAMR